MDSDELYRQMLMTALAAGLPAISTDTAARILAVVHVHGENEAFTFCPRLHTDLEYISRRFHVHGAGTPAPEFAALVRKYSGELRRYEREHEYRGVADLQKVEAVFEGKTAGHVAMVLGEFCLDTLYCVKKKHPEKVRGTGRLLIQSVERSVSMFLDGMQPDREKGGIHGEA